MKKLLLLSLVSLALLCLNGCATTTSLTPGAKADVSNGLTAAQNAISVATVLVNTTGPLAVAGVCVSSPKDCAAAQKGIAAARVTLATASDLVALAQTANTAPNGAQLSTLLSGIVQEIQPINSLIIVYGGKPLDLTPFTDALAKIQVTTQ